MIVKTYIFKQKLCAGSKKMINNSGGVSIVFLAIVIFVTLLILTINLFDYSMYSYKVKVLSRSIDSSVCAAIQEVDKDSVGLETEFTESGEDNTNNIKINEISAINAFYSTFTSNIKIDKSIIDPFLLIAILNPDETGINYIIKKGSSRFEGRVDKPSEIQSIINTHINTDFTEVYEGQKSVIVNINGNVDTNQFKKRPYFIVFLKDWQINGIVSKRLTTFIDFSGAKIERQK